MSAQFIGGTINQKMGPMGIAAQTIVARGDVVRVVNGLVVAIVNAQAADMAVVLENNPDPDFEGVKTQVDLAFLGEDQEVDLPFVCAAGIAVADIGVAHNILAANGGTANLDLQNAAAFVVRRFADGTVVGDLAGHVIGVFLDAASL